MHHFLARFLSWASHPRFVMLASSHDALLDGGSLPAPLSPLYVAIAAAATHDTAVNLARLFPPEGSQGPHHRAADFARREISRQTKIKHRRARAIHLP